MALNTRTALETACYNYVDSILPTSTVIFANENGPRPVGPYVTLNLITQSVRVGSDDYLESSPTVTELNLATRGQRTATLSINAYGQTAYDELWLLKQSLDLPNNKATAIAQGIAILRDQDVVDLSRLRDNEIEKRAQMDIIIGYDVSISESGADYFNIVQGTNEINDTEYEVDGSS